MRIAPASICLLALVGACANDLGGPENAPSKERARPGDPARGDDVSPVDPTDPSDPSVPSDPSDPTDPSAPLPAFPETPAALRALITDKLAAAGAPGGQACIVRRGAVAWCDGFGLARIDTNKPMTPATPMIVASISKTFTTVALMSLVEDGEITLDDDIDTLVPFTVEHPSSAAPITVRSALTHTSGIGNRADYAEIYGEVATLEDRAPVTIALEPLVRGYLDPAGQFYDAVNFHPWGPGGGWEYSNNAFALLGYVVERHAEEPFAAAVQHRVLAPLQMPTSSFEHAGMIENAMPYAVIDGQYEPYGHYSIADVPAGALRTTSYELARFVAAITRGGELDGARILEAETVAEILALVEPNPSTWWSQALGFYAVPWRDEMWHGHGGDLFGITTDMYFRMSDGTGYVLLRNGDRGDAVAGWEIEEALADFAETL